LIFLIVETDLPRYNSITRSSRNFAYDLLFPLDYLQERV
jgi:hypothetical protein